MRKVLEVATIDNAFEFAQQDVYDLHESMRDSADNMPEQLNTAYANAADNLSIAIDYLLDCGAPTELCNVEVTWKEWRGKLYRSQLRDNVVNFLRAYLARVPQKKETEKLRSDLQDAIGILVEMFFPGMSGRRAA
jgi:hypothetical protein